MNVTYILLFLLLLIGPSIANGPPSFTGVATGRNGDVYVLRRSESASFGVVKYSSSGEYMKEISNPIYQISSIDKATKTIFIKRKSIGTPMTDQDIVTLASVLKIKPKKDVIANYAIKNIFYPDNIAIGKNDVVYATGLNVFREGSGYIAVINSNDGHTIRAFGEFTREDVPYGLWNPRGIAVDRDDNIYVANQGPYCVKKFSSDGRFLAKWGQRGAADGEFKDPMGIAVDPRNSDVYILDDHLNSGNYSLQEQMRVQKFNKDGKFLKKWGERKGLRWPGYFNSFKDRLIWAVMINPKVLIPEIATIPIIYEPAGIVVDQQGYVYVAERANFRINKFTSDGNLVKRWGRRGSGPGEFLFGASGELISMAVDRDDNVYVVDKDNNRVQKFNCNGKLMQEIK